MRRARGRFNAIVVAACVAATLIAVPSAQAAVSQSQVTVPAGVQYLLYTSDTPNTISIAGTSNGTTGDNVDLVCYAGDRSGVLASNVAVGSGGSFSVPAAGLAPALLYRVCNLRAVPAGTTPGDLSPYAGPRLLVGETERDLVSGGPNSGKLYNYYLYFQGVNGGDDYAALGECGLGDGYLLDSTDSLTTVTWFCNAFLDDTDAVANPTRSEIQVDGANAYTPKTAEEINPAAPSGFPAISSYSYGQDAKTGNSVIHETDPIVKCPNATYPATNVTCPSFTSAGVTDTRTITQTQGGNVVWITDVFKNTSGKRHRLDLLWQNDQHFFGNSGNANQVEYEFPGQSSYSMHSVGDVVNLPNQPGTIFVRYHGAASGDATHGRGAIVYDHAATAAKFMKLTANQSDFTLHQSGEVPAHGTTTLRFAYIGAFHQAVVVALANEVAGILQRATVPNVVGKRLAAAKKAIVRAGCAVGKITRVRSARVRAGRVISERPKASTHVTRGTKVRLVVSKGKKR
jgi:hypothetical protein